MLDGSSGGHYKYIKKNEASRTARRTVITCGMNKYNFWFDRIRTQNQQIQQAKATAAVATATIATF